MRVVVTLVLGMLFAATLAVRSVGAAQASPVEVTVTTSKGAYQPGMLIDFTIYIQNVSLQTVVLRFPTTQRFDVVLRSPALEIDRWSRDRVFADVMAEQRLAPGQTVTYADRFLPRNVLLPVQVGVVTPQALSRGLYSIHAEIAIAPEPLVSRPQSLIIGVPTELPVGCTTLAEQPRVETPIIAAARSVDPPTALHSIWQRSTLSLDYVGYTPRPSGVSDLGFLNTRFPVTVCLTAPAVITIP